MDFEYIHLIVFAKIANDIVFFTLQNRGQYYNSYWAHLWFEWVVPVLTMAESLMTSLMAACV